MRVLQINSFFNVGGPPRIMNGIYDTLLEKGIECRIAAAREYKYAPEASIQIGSKLSVDVNVINARMADNEGFNAVCATKKLIKEIDAYDPDIIHLHNLHGYYVNVEILFDYLKTIQKPIIWTLHDCWPFTGHCAFFDSVSCEQWKLQCVDCAKVHAYPSAIGKGRVSANFERKRKCFSGLKNLTLVTPSVWLAANLKESFLGVYPVEVIHNGIDLDQFHPVQNDYRTRYGIENKKIVLGVAQVWDERKGFKDYLKLADVLNEDCQVIMVGLTQKQKKKIPKNIIGISRTNSVKELAAIYTEADVFVNMTYEDNFPTVNIEALACGTPIITYRTGGSPEAIDDSCGWIVEQGDIESVKRVIDSIKDKSQYQMASIERSKLFDRKASYLKYVALYKRVLGEESTN